MGYRFQFVTLAGFHALNLSMFELAHDYARTRHDGLFASATARIRNGEKHGYGGVKHQRFVGTGYFDAVATTIAAGQTSTCALPGSTEEEQFESRQDQQDEIAARAMAVAKTQHGASSPVSEAMRLTSDQMSLQWGCQMSSTTQSISEASASSSEILTPAAMEFLRSFDQRFEPARQQLLRSPRRRQEQFDRGKLPTFSRNPRRFASVNGRVAPIPADLLDRRVEITGPTDRKMVINALNSGANVFMADFEDANSPTWNNCIEGQRNLRDANLRHH